ncbi:exosome complex component MTR3 [Gastrophryne carolinensis]
MPVDSRRVRGPEDGSQSPALYAVREDEAGDGKPQRVCRGPAEQRALFVRAGALSQAAGSAYAEAGPGGSKVLCGVWWGAGEGRLLCDLRWPRFSSRSLRPDRGGGAQLLRESLQPAVRMESYPRAELMVSVLVLEDRGAALALAITTAALALADAGIQMYDLVVATALCRAPTGSTPTLRLDPTEGEEEAAPGTLCLALMPNLNQVSGLLCSGEWEGDSVPEAMKLCMEGCHRLYPLLQQSLLKSTKKKIPAPGAESAQPQ